MQKLIWPERLRNLATLMVVAIHVSAPIPMQGTNYDSSQWWTGNIWCSLCRPAVPLFVMLSGYLLLSKQYTLGDFLRKRLMRVAVPALFWFPIYTLYNHFANQKPATFHDALIGLVQGPVHYHLWFIYLIIGLYLTYPIFAPFARSAKESEFLFFFGVCLFGTWGVKALWDCYHIGSMLYIETYTNNAIYFIGGYYLGHKMCSDEVNLHPNIKPWPIASQQMKWLSIALILISLATTAGFSWYASKAQGSFFPFYYDYLNPTVTIGAIGWFLFARYLLNHGALGQWEADFSVASFGIYFAHPLLCDWWSVSGYWQDKYHPALCIPVVLGLVFITTFMAVLLIRVLPGGEKVT